jgi:dTDP-4-dehydrorhamnose reductase
MDARFSIASNGGVDITSASMASGRKILITGTTGRLGSALRRHYQGRHQVLAPARAELNLSRPDEIPAQLGRLDFDLLIHCAAMGSPDQCEREPALAATVNHAASTALARECAARPAQMIQISTDYVFSGEEDRPLDEDDEAMPICHYGHTKRAAELAVLSACPGALVARVSWLFGAGNSFPDQVLRDAAAGKPICGIEDKWSVPTSVHDIALWLEALWDQQPPAQGVLHLCNSGRASWRTYAQEVCDRAHELGILPAPVSVQGSRLADFQGFLARRPQHTVLSNQRLAQLLGAPVRSWQEALAEWLAVSSASFLQRQGSL